MQRIIIMNAKGGCGKTTIATNLASCYAIRGYGTALFDYDPQASSMRWLQERPNAARPIHGVAAYEPPPVGCTRTFQLRVPADTERVVIDTPAGLMGQELVEQVRGVDTIIVPVLPSPIDIYSTADFVRRVLNMQRSRMPATRVAIVANRVKSKTRAYQSLERFFESLQLPVIARLRDTNNYVQAVEYGLGVEELDLPEARADHLPWEHMLAWLEGESYEADVAAPTANA